MYGQTIMLTKYLIQNKSEQDISSNTQHTCALFIYYMTIYVSLTCFVVSNAIFREKMCEKHGIILVEVISLCLKDTNKMKLCMYCV